MHKSFRFVFFGTPEFAAVVLEKLIAAGWPPAVVVCNPDRPAGRKKIIAPPPVKMRFMNYDLGIKNKSIILQPANPKSLFLNLKSLQIDFAVVAAYGKIIAKEILDLFPKGVIGIHPSLLPKYRGPSPIQTALLNGDAETGVSLFLMDEKTDHGPVLANSRWQMANGENYEFLLKKLAEIGTELLIATLPKWLAGKIKLVQQDESLASYTKKFITEDGFVDLEKDDSVIIERKIRALNPEPGVYTYMDLPGKKKRVKLLEALLKDGKLFITKIQVEGQKPKNV